MKLIRVLIEQLIDEGVYDPAIFKAVFVLGGPGSGKSYVTDKSTKGLGFKLLDSDIQFEYLMNKLNLDLKMPPEEKEKRRTTRAKAKAIHNREMDRHIENRLGLIIGGTGRDDKKVQRQINKLRSFGYDVYIIFVNTSLAVALDRNEKRTRSLPPEIVKNSWENAQNNIGAFQKMVGKNNMSIVDNSVVGDDEKFDDIWKEIMKFSKRKIENPKAVEWISGELNKRKNEK